MSRHDKKIPFPESEVGIQTRLELQKLLQDTNYTTSSEYNSNESLYPDNVISFVEKHMQYLSRHPAVNPTYYMANLRLMTKVKINSNHKTTTLS